MLNQIVEWHLLVKILNEPTITGISSDDCDNVFFRKVFRSKTEAENCATVLRLQYGHTVHVFRHVESIEVASFVD